MQHPLYRDVAKGFIGLHRTSVIPHDLVVIKPDVSINVFGLGRM